MMGGAHYRAQSSNGPRIKLLRRRGGGGNGRGGRDGRGHLPLDHDRERTEGLEDRLDGPDVCPDVFPERVRGEGGHDAGVRGGRGREVDDDVAEENGYLGEVEGHWNLLTCSGWTCDPHRCLAVRRA